MDKEIMDKFRKITAGLAESGILPFVIRKNIERLYEDLKNAINSRGFTFTKDELAALERQVCKRLELDGFYKGNGRICPSSPRNLLLAYGLFSEGINAKAFGELYKAEWTPRNGEGLFEKAQKIEPDSAIEREVLEVLIFTALKLIELDRMFKSVGMRARESDPEKKFTCSWCLAKYPKTGEGRLADH